MILRMRATRYWPLGAALALCAAALFAGGALRTGPLTWFGGGALIAVLALLAVRGAPRGVLRLLPLAALAAWCGASIWWSTLPDASWDYANRALVYLLFALVGLWLADRTRELAVGLAVLLAAVAVWALLGKVIPTLPGDYSTTVAGPSIARLRGPAGLWNQLALLGDFALPLALWIAGRRRIVGSLLAFVWIVALLLTYSRGGLAVAVLVVAVWFVWGDERLDAFGALVAAGPARGGRRRERRLRCRGSRATARACTRAATTGSSSASCSPSACSRPSHSRGCCACGEVPASAARCSLLGAVVVAARDRRRRC